MVKKFLLKKFSNKPSVKVNKKLFTVRKNQILKNSILDTLFILIKKDEVIILNKLTNYKKKLDIDQKNINYLIKYRLNQPFKTIYSNLFIFPPYSKLIIENDNLYIEILFPEKSASQINYKNAINYFDNYTKNNFSKKKNINLSFSGGSDSLFLLSFFIENKINVKLICHLMPGLEKKQIELLKQIKKKYKIEYELHNNFNKKNKIEIIKKYTQEYCIPILDPVMVNYQLMHFNKKKSIIVDGQNADSLFIGLPHQKLIKFYKRFNKLRFLFKVLNLFFQYRIEPKNNITRNLYRIKKALNSLSSNDWIDCFIHSLDLPKGESDLKKIIISSYKFYQDELLVISYIFLFYIIPQREFQKFSTSRNVFYLPFNNQKLIESVFCSNSNLIYGDNGKSFIFERVKSFFNIDLKGKTNPFYVKDQNKNDLLLHSLNFI